MKLQDLKNELKEQEIRIETMSFYSQLNDAGYSIEADDSYFGTCDISGETGELVSCTVALENDEVIEIMVSVELCGGHLGKLAGAF